MVMAMAMVAEELVQGNVAAINPKQWLAKHEPCGPENIAHPLLVMGGEAISASDGCVVKAIEGFPDLSIEITLAYLMEDKCISKSTREKILWLSKEVERARTP